MSNPDATDSQSDESGLSRDESADAHFCWDESGTKRDESAALGDSPPHLHDREHAPHDVRVRLKRLPRPPASPHVHPRVFIDKQVVPGFGTVNQHSHLRSRARHLRSRGRVPHLAGDLLANLRDLVARVAHRTVDQRAIAAGGTGCEVLALERSPAG